MSRSATAFVLLAGISSFPVHPARAAQIPLNLGFELPGVEGFVRPWGWNVVSWAEEAKFALDTVIRRSGARSLVITRPAGADSTSEHALRLWIAPQFALGNRVAVRGWLRAEKLAGQGRIVLESWGDGMGAADTTAITSGSAATGWNQLDLSVPVDSSSHSIVVTVGLVGAGTVWFDDFEVESQGHTWTEVPGARAPENQTLEWLASRSHSFRTVDADSLGRDDFADLTSFGEIVGDARVVALGEATHGTSEFFRVKHRLVTYLVEHMGFRVFAVEANQLAVEPINDYVQSGAGDTRTLMRAMFRVWNTEEMQDLIEWMRVYNAQHPDDMVEFIGFDMQDPSMPIDSVSAFIGRVEPRLKAWVDSLYAPHRDAWRETNYPQGPDAVRNQWFANAQQVYEAIASRRDAWLTGAQSLTDSAVVQWAIQNANVARQSALSALTFQLSTRDSAMAENIRWSLNQRSPQTRMMVWAHDGHISRAEHEFANYWGGGSMGGALAKSYGNDYRAFGLLTYDGSYSGSLGSAIIDTRLLAAPVGSPEEALHQVAQQIGSQLLITDIRNADGAAGGAWLLEPRLIRMIGYAAEDIGFGTGISVGKQFDGIVFVDTTTPSRVFRRQ